MSELPPIVVQILAETDQLKAQMATVQTKLAEVGGSARTAVEPVGKLQGQFKELGATMAKGFAVVELVKFLSESGKAASDDAQSFALMERQLKTTTGATKAQTEAVNNQLEAMSDVSGVLMTKLRPSFTTFVRATGDSSKALQLQKVALDVAAGTGKDLQTVTMAMSKALAGNAGALNRIVPGAKGASNQIKYLQDTFKGAAKTAADANPYERFQNTMEKLKVSLGGAVLPLMKALTDILKPLIPIFTRLGKIIGYVVGEVMKLVKPLVDALMPVFNALMPLIMVLVKSALKPMVDILILLMPLIKLVAEFITIWVGIFTKVFDAMYKVGDFIRTNFLNWLKMLGDKFSWISGIIKPFLDTIAKILNIDISPTITPTVDMSNVQDIGASDFLPSKSGTSTGESPMVKHAKETQKALAKANEEYQKSVLNANKAYKDEVQKQIDDFQNIFRDATRVDVGQLFQDGYRTADSMIGALKARLTGMSNFAQDVGKLSAAGYSGEFIKEVMSQGAIAGDQMAQSLLSASPEAQAQIKDLFAQTQQVSSNGVRSVATGLTDLFTSAANTLTDALNNAADKLTASVEKLRTDASNYANTNGGKSISGAGSNGSPKPNAVITNHNVTINTKTDASAADIARKWLNSVKFGAPLTSPVNSMELTPSAIKNWESTLSLIPASPTH